MLTAVISKKIIVYGVLSNAVTIIADHWALDCISFFQPSTKL